MAGSSYGNLFKITTWGESHGKALGVVIDGCPSGINLKEEDIQKDLDKRKPGNSKFATARKESDKVQILSGVFEDKTTGTPISLVVFNEDQKSKDYSNISNSYRPGHADYGYDIKFSFRDYRGGGRSSARETLARVSAGAVAKKILNMLDIEILAYTQELANVTINEKNFDKLEIYNNSLRMPDKFAYEQASKVLEEIKQEGDSCGGIATCKVKGLKAGVGNPVFDKLDACLGKALFSLGAVKAVEFGIGQRAASLKGSENNDEFYFDGNETKKKTNNSGGVLGGFSDGDEIVIKTYFKPTPSISKPQNTINSSFDNTEIIIQGRHDPTVVPRAIPVIEAMVAITIVDLIMIDSVSKIDKLISLYKGEV